LSTSYKILFNIFLSEISTYADGIIGIIVVGSDVTDQLLIRIFAFVRYWSTMRQYISYS
jgi:hypothetical protein